MKSKRAFRYLKIGVFILSALVVGVACDISVSGDAASDSPDGVIDTPPDDQASAPPPEEDPPSQLPPPQPPTAGQPPSQSAAAYTFNHLTPLLPEVYYGPCTTEETVVTIQTAFNPTENVDGVYLQYFYQWNEATYSDYYTSPMSEMGIGDWIGDIDAGLEAGDTLGITNGQIFYTVAIQDVNGAVTYSPGQWLNVTICTVAAPPPPSPEPTAPPIETGLTIKAFNVTNPAIEGSTIHLEWEIEGADCEITLNGTPVEATGSQDDEVPLGNGGTSWYYILEAYGPPCEDPVYVFQEVDILIESVEGQVLTQFGKILNTEDQVDFDVASGPGDAVLMAHPDDNADGRPFIMQRPGTNTIFAGVSSQPTVADCVSAVDQWSTITVWMDEGFFFCFQTDEGHYGYFYRSGMGFDTDKSTWEVSLEITTWDSP